MTTSTLIPPRTRDVQVAEIAPSTLIFRSRTWERLKFEVEYARQKGTTANSYLLRSEKIALLDPPGESFTAIFLAELEKHLAWEDLDYIILSHVNPNRMATLREILTRASRVRVFCSKPGANAIKNAFPEWESRLEPIRSEDTLDLGENHQLQLLTIPTPRWPDGIFTYDSRTKILYTDKFFGAHLCGDDLYDEDWKKLDEDRRYYFDCLHGAQTKQVEDALDKLATIPAKYYAPAHGPVVRYSLSRLSHDYRYWCQQQKKQSLTVALLYASAYGNTAILAQAIAQGLMEQDIKVESINCELAQAEEMTEIVASCDGFLIGSPTLGGHAPVQIQTALGIVLASASKTKLAGVFGSYGWSGEAIDLIEGKLRDGNYRLGFEPIRVRFTPTEEDLEKCRSAGAEFAQILKKSKKYRVPRQGLTEAQSDRTAQAVGRVIGSLCVVSTHEGGFLTSWVSQASFTPPGIMIALSEEQNAQALVAPDTPFVLNILQEGRGVRKHFSYRYEPEAEPFSQLATAPAENGCLIIQEALAYLECRVQSRIQVGEQWLIYALVEGGEVLETSGVTAISHRKSGSVL